MIKFEINKEGNKIDVDAQGTTNEILSDIANGASSLICSIIKNSNLEPSDALVEAFNLYEALSENILELTARRMSDLYGSENAIEVVLGALKRFEKEDNK